MSQTDLLEKIGRARSAIDIAESELDDLLKSMQTSKLGDEKVGISQVLGDAFEKLRAAKAALVKLEESKSP